MKKIKEKTKRRRTKGREREKEEAKENFFILLKLLKKNHLFPISVKFTN